MQNPVRYYNKNRKKIWAIVIIFTSTFIILQLLGFMNKKNSEDKIKQTQNTEVVENDLYNTDTTTLKDNQSVISNEKISNDTLQNAVNIIDEFVNYCNNGNLQEAYDMLTEECKNEMYSNLDEFNNFYYKEIYKGEKKSCSLEYWTKGTYLVKYYGDLLATGGKKSDLVTQEYITLKKNDQGEYKLNINDFIGTTEINKETEHKEVIVKVLRKNTYMDYEEYVLEVKNNNEFDIIMDTLYYPDTLYIQDENEIKYSAYTQELTSEILRLSKGERREIKIKFYCRYSSNKSVKKMVFSKMQLCTPPNAENIEFKVDV